MAAAITRDTLGTDPGMYRADTPPNGLRFAVYWNGQLIALCSTQAEANAVAALHPA